MKIYSGFVGDWPAKRANYTLPKEAEVRAAAAVKAAARETPPTCKVQGSMFEETK